MRMYFMLIYRLTFVRITIRERVIIRTVHVEYECNIRQIPITINGSASTLERIPCKAVRPIKPLGAVVSFDFLLDTPWDSIGST